MDERVLCASSGAGALYGAALQGEGELRLGGLRGRNRPHGLRVARALLTASREAHTKVNLRVTGLNEIHEVSFRKVFVHSGHRPGGVSELQLVAMCWLLSCR